MVVSQLAVQPKQADQAEVAEVLVEGVAAKLSGHAAWVLPCIVRLQLSTEQTRAVRDVSFQILAENHGL